MNIPLKIVKSPQELSPKYISFHQKFAKDLHKTFQRKKPNRVNHQTSLDSLTTLPSEEIKKEIYDWFFNLDTSTKLKVCSIHNKYLVNILTQLIILYSYDENVTLIPSKENYWFQRSEGNFENVDDDDVGYIGMNECFYNSRIDYEKGYESYREETEIDFYPFLFQELRMESEPMSPIQKHQKDIEREFIDNISFFSVDERNDAITINQFFLENSTQFKAMLENFSDENIFKDWIEPDYDSDTKLFNYRLPQWIKKKRKFTVASILTIYFEQMILLNYEYYYFTKKIYPLPCGEVINNILDQNLKLENFLLGECGTDKKKTFFDSINFRSIQDNLTEDNEVIEQIRKIRSTKEKIAKRYYKYGCIDKKIQISDLMKDIIQKMKVNFMQSIPGFVNLISFPGKYEVLKCLDYITKKTYGYLLDLLSNKSALDLINDIEETGTKHKTHKKKKKKNKKEDVLVVEEKKEMTQVEEEKKSIAIQTEKEIVKKCEDNVIDKKEEIKDIIHCNNEEVLNEEKVTDEIQKNKDKATKSKKKKNNFFLFPITSKRKQKQLEQEKAKESIIHKIETLPQKESNVPKTPSPKNSENKSTIITHQITESIITSPTSNSNSVSTSTSPSIKSNTIYNNSNIVQSSQYPYYPSQTYISAYYNILKNLCLYHPPASFYNKLSKEIEEYNSHVSSNLSILNKYRLVCLSNIEELIKEKLSEHYEIDIVHYGSFVTELSIETSDIDLLVNYSPKDSKEDSNVKTIISELNSYFTVKGKNIFDSILPIYTASVPIIKLQCDISKNITKEEYKKIYSNFSFGREEIIKVKFDITFNQVKSIKNYKKITPLLTVDFVKKALSQNSNIKPLLLLLKRYFKLMKLNNSFKGGLSSYSLFLLIYAFFNKNKGFVNSGMELFNFLECYSSYYALGMYLIDPNNKENPFTTLSKEKTGQIVILDPFTKLNVAKSSFKTDEIKMCLMKAMNALKCTSWKGEKYYENKNVILKELFSIK